MKDSFHFFFKTLAFSFFVTMGLEVFFFFSMSKAFFWVAGSILLMGTLRSAPSKTKAASTGLKFWPQVETYPLRPLLLFFCIALMVGLYVYHRFSTFYFPLPVEAGVLTFFLLLLMFFLFPSQGN